MDQNWQKFQQLGQEAQQNSNILLAFYLKTYQCELMVNQHKIMKQQNDPEAGKLATMINQIFSELEQMKNQNANLKNKEQNKQQLIGFIQSNLAQVQQSLNQGSYTPNNKQILEKNISYIDCLQQFGPLTSDLNNLRNVAQQKLGQFGNINRQQSQNDDFNVPQEGGIEQVNKSIISMQNNQQFLNNQTSPNNNLLNPQQQDAYYQEAFNKLSQSRINDMDRSSIQRILEIATNINQFDQQQNIPQKMPSQMPSKIEQQQRIKSIYHPPNFDTFNVKDGQPSNENNNNNNLNMDYNFGTPNPDLLKQSNLQKLNDQQSTGQLYDNINNNFNQPTSQDTNHYFFNNNQQQSTIQKPQQPPVDNFGTPNPDYNFNQWNQQNQFQPPVQNQVNNFQPSSYNNNNGNNLQPSSYNNNNNNINNQNPSNFNNINNNIPFVGQQQPPKQPSTIQQPPVQQQQSKIPVTLPAAQGKSYPMTSASGIRPKSNGLIKIQTIKMCEQTIAQMKSGSLEQVKNNLIEAIKLLDEVQI